MTQIDRKRIGSPLLGTMRLPFALIVLTGLLLASCQSAAPTGIPQDTQPVLTPEGTKMISPVTPDAIAEKMADLSKAHLARKLGITVDQITLSEVEPVQWPDASLGCGRAGVIYVQVVTFGFNILLEAKGQAFTYHTDSVSQVILCDARPPDEIYLTP